MNRSKVTSSSIAEIGYDRDQKILEIKFNVGTVYQYHEVPEDAYIMLITADSHGQYFNAHIRDAYTTVKIG